MRASISLSPSGQLRHALLRTIWQLVLSCILPTKKAMYGSMPMTPLKRGPLLKLCSLFTTPSMSRNRTFIPTLQVWVEPILIAVAHEKLVTGEPAHFVVEVAAARATPNAECDLRAAEFRGRMFSEQL